MNLLINTLNAWAEHALRFAWPMLWQSSLLIGLLFTLDLLMRRKVRPAVRYALWLLVLVKLLLPPSLALPTNPGWWLRQAKVSPAVPRATTVVVTYDAVDSPTPTAAAMPVFAVPPPPRLTPAAWGFVGILTISLGLLGWMAVRWQQVARDARRAAAAPARLRELLPELRHPVRLRLTDQPQSPAVCGLFRPVILLPRSLAEHLSPAQLRAVLLHELLHLRRGDVWVNCAQALLQIAYWWHPLLWFANARIRRVREEAVDDAVMLALNEDAEAYAPTLLEVAKLALHRPLASLGLVGILESRSSLRQRIERLMDFHPPRKAGLTLASALAVLGFAALAVPMGEAPASSEVPQSAGNDTATRSSVPQASTNASVLLDQIIRIKTLVQDGKLLYEMGKLNEAEAKLREALREDPQNPTAAYYLNLVGAARQQAPTGLSKVPSVANPEVRINKAGIGDDRRSIINALNDIRLDRVSFDRLPLSEVVQFLADESRKRDPRKLGINLVLNSPESAASPRQGALEPGTGQPKAGTPPTAIHLPDLPITIKPPVTEVRLADVLDLIVKVAGQPIKYSIESYAVVFSAKTGQDIPPLYVRTFKVDPNTLLGGLRAKLGPVATNKPGAITAALRAYFASGGVDLDPVRNPGKSLFYNDGQDMLLVRATLQDLDIIEPAIPMLNHVPPQINIKCKFVEVSQDDTKPFGFGWYLGNLLTTNGVIGGQTGTVLTASVPNSSNQFWTSGSRVSSTSFITPTGILTDPQYRVVIKALQQRSGTELLAQPEVTISSDRQAQMKTVDVKTMVLGINKRALTPPGITTTNENESSLYVTEQMELGPVLDVIPSVLPDGYTIELTVIPTVTEFLGYEENPTNRVAVYVNGKKKWVIPPQPKFRVCQMNTSVRVRDGQTVVLGGLLSETVKTIKDQVPILGSLPLVGSLFCSETKTTAKKNLLVFVTPTLIDPAGNLVHTKEQVPDGIPPQPPR
jgi:type II secretory pathway component GspD/PulD (secretin)/beta-lactamase regulating signal transducer with metallopeptidase domain